MYQKLTNLLFIIVVICSPNKNVWGENDSIYVDLKPIVSQDDTLLKTNLEIGINFGNRDLSEFNAFSPVFNAGKSNSSALFTKVYFPMNTDCEVGLGYQFDRSYTSVNDINYLFNFHSIGPSLKYIIARDLNWYFHLSGEIHGILSASFYANDRFDFTGSAYSLEIGANHPVPIGILSIILQYNETSLRLKSNPSSYSSYTSIREVYTKKLSLGLNWGVPLN